ncbi:MAG: dihydrodipicolinate synthase family protein [Opitutaceae bacterium]|nr:dihydrodipicolinate synthase family protein [Opitutaceae bacterium]MBP9913462.1 dihydrodipicolinate synthase family protein [Opitutaceae bacterium]
MDLRSHLLTGHVIPAQPLALDANRKFSERHQRAITRYYVASGIGGLAVGVHSTQFEIREPQHGLFKPVLELAARTIDEELAKAPRPFIKIAGLCGQTAQALKEAETALGYGYHAGLLSLSAFKHDTEDAMIAHCQRVAAAMPIVGFYLQPAAGGRLLGYSFWRRFAEIKNVIAIKIAPFNRYQTIDVVRAVAEAGRDDIAIYTGNDDSIVVDLFTPFTFDVRGKKVIRRIIGGLLGHWGVWTSAAVKLLNDIKQARTSPQLDVQWLDTAIAVTDMNAALFDAANKFAGCIPGILEILRRQGLVPSIHCLNPHEGLSPGQAEELTRVCRAYPQLTDDAFIAANRDKWLN